MQELDIFDIEFYEYSMIAEDPKKLEQLQNHFYDPEFDEFMEEFNADIFADLTLKSLGQFIEVTGNAQGKLNLL